MCQRVTCADCEKPDWKGCGAHIEQVLGDVPNEERCKCREEGRREATPSPGLWGRLFGRG